MPSSKGTYQLKYGQRLPFMFEIWKKGAPAPEWQYVLPINPEIYELTRTPRINLTKTAEGAYVDNLGPGFDVINISGTFGYLGVMGGHARTLRQESDLVGWDLFKELETAFLDLYEKFATVDAYGRKIENLLDANWEIHFYNFADEDDFNVEVNRFRFLRSLQRKHLYQYDIQMVVKGRVMERPGQRDKVLQILLDELNEPATEELSLWGKLLAGYSQLYSGMSDIINTVHDIRYNMAVIGSAIAGFKNLSSDFIAAPFGLVDSTINLVDTTIDTARGIVGLPHEFIDLMRREKRKLLSYRLKKDKFRTSTASVSQSSTATEILTAPLPGGQIASDNNAITMLTPETTLFDPSLETAQEVAAYEESVTANDTMEQIAVRTLGNATDWRRIAVLNGLEYPYVVRRPLDAYSPILETGTLATDLQAGYRTVQVSGMTPVPGNLIVMVSGDTVQALEVESFQGVVTFVLPADTFFPAGTVVTRHERALNVMKPGDRMKIPGTSNQGAAITDNPTSFYAQLFGVDEALVTGKHIETPTGGLLDAEGLANIEMQLAHRLNTRRGELAALGHPEYGSLMPLFIGKTGEDYIHSRIRMEAKATILQDPRVKSVDSVDFTVNGTEVYIDVECTLIGQTSLQTKILVV